MSVTSDDRQRQLEYHTVYFYQVLTLDRGTTAGILSHADNDVGVLGSLPQRIDPNLLASWMEKTPPITQPLLRRLIDAVPEDNDRIGKNSAVGKGWEVGGWGVGSGWGATKNGSLVSAEVRKELARAVRSFYNTDTRAKMALQAEMDMVRWAEALAKQR